jgi:hypothetical protein
MSLRGCRALRDPLDDGERFRGKAMAAPVLIAICARVQSPHKVPESEQVLAVGAAAMNMLNALHLLGYGGFWATGLNSYDRHVHQALGLQDAERLLGFLYVGTPKEATRAPERHAPTAFVREWTASSSVARHANGPAGQDRAAGDKRWRVGLEARLQAHRQHAALGLLRQLAEVVVVRGDRQVLRHAVLRAEARHDAGRTARDALVARHPVVVARDAAACTRPAGR